jgi:hypothetical protein
VAGGNWVANRSKKKRLHVADSKREIFRGNPPRVFSEKRLQAVENKEGGAKKRAKRLPFEAQGKQEAAKC